MKHSKYLHPLEGVVRFASLLVLVLFVCAIGAKAQTSAPPAQCGRTVKADVVALDQVFYYNRLGSLNPAGMIFALRRDVIPTGKGTALTPGAVQLRPDKRPRPLTLRMNAGDCLEITFTNLLAPVPTNNNQPGTRTASIHVNGLDLVGSIASDGSNVGQNPSSLVAPGGTAVYTYMAQREGNHLMYSTADTTGGEANTGTLAMGLFGAVNVEPSGAEWYRSQLTAVEMQMATKKDASGLPMKTAGGQPIMDYDALYPIGHPRAGQPILKILDATNTIIHTDLNAVITGPNKGRFPAGTYRANAVEPDRDQPFREFTVVYHDEVKAVQAFPQFQDPVLSYTLSSVKDGFAINYGSTGAGAEVLANRLGVGPMKDCTDCLYEEFFLSSWAIGDPAQIVDVPANALAPNGRFKAGAKATKVLFPDDPSNVHHSYLNDHVKMRVVHAGKEHHIHHLHAHQWLNTPDSDNSSYIDSQAMGPGSAFTTEIAHGGSGNRNKTPGDSIFHCHFYPHFAQGMWEIWRTHDVFEAGTELDKAGIPVLNARALPDGEIANGSPIPALVPIPTIAMAPMPTAEFKGYPFYVPGVAGHRPPRPPLDTLDDGGLPRHVITGGTAVSTETRLDFSKELLTATAVQIPEGGTPAELAAMNFHAQKEKSSFRPDGTVAAFKLNGLRPVAGAPFADPCRDDAGNAIGNPRVYKAAAIQIDLKLNKAGWHFPQSRILTLWDDVLPTMNGNRPPEPLFFRANTNDCITFYHTNLTAKNYALDDFQVKTPTDIMGQHIHLVKFDVTSSDGAGNGFNYEDGTLAPDEVITRIAAINKTGGLRAFGGTTQTLLSAKPHPYFGTLGAQTTIQRWFADPTLNMGGKDRTLGTVFSHDHFGPSTHQQTGLYSGLVTEPFGSTWKHNETGLALGTRHDGGPTSWQAIITTPNTADSYREFLLEFGDYHLAYKAGGGGTLANPFPDPLNAINPPVKNEVGLPFNLQRANVCPGGAPLPCPEAISSADPGTMTVNYRNEPLALRVQNPNTNTQATGDAGDLSKAYLSNITRANPLLNLQPNFFPPLTGGLKPGDPFTPLLRAYEGDRVQIRTLVGAHEEGHNFSLNGNKWLYEHADPNSGYRNSQMMGISEHFRFDLPGLSAIRPNLDYADYLYKPSSSVGGQWNGVWGIMRAYNGTKGLQPDLVTTPNNPLGKVNTPINDADFVGVCPRTAPLRTISVTAVTAKNALPGGTLVYNNRPGNGGQLHDPTAILYVRTADLDATGKLKAGVPIEPLVLRATAGECVEVTLNNKLPNVMPDVAGFSTLPMIVDDFNANQIKPSNQIGLHPQLLAYDVTSSDGVNVGLNPVQTVGPGGAITYRWYAGDLRMNGSLRVATPVEFGATNLISSDPIKHSNKGAIGSLIIEPQGATWIEDATSRASATVFTSGGTSFREFVLQFQNDINLRFGDLTGDAAAVPNSGGAEDSDDTGQKALNYRTEPLWKRLGYQPNTPLDQTRLVDYSYALSNAQVGGDPVTPVFTAQAGMQIRFRILQSSGHGRNNVFNLYGHIWQQLPYTNGSTRIGSNPLSEWRSASAGHGATNHFDIIPVFGAGGARRVTGDYLFRTMSAPQFDGGIWGIFRVTP